MSDLHGDMARLERNDPERVKALDAPRAADPFAVSEAAAQVGRDLLEILDDEARAAVGEVTGERRQRFERALVALPGLLAREAAGEDVAVKLLALRSILADYRAVAALVLARGAERALARGLKVVGTALGVIARALLERVLPGALPS